MSADAAIARPPGPGRQLRTAAAAASLLLARPASCLAAAHAAACSRSAGGFVIDEDGLGYADVGEEVDWGVAEEEPQAEDAGSGGKKGKKGAPAFHCC